MEVLLLVGSPLLGALTLGLLGARRWAPALNVAFSTATFAAAMHAIFVRVSREADAMCGASTTFARFSPG